MSSIRIICDFIFLIISTYILFSSVKNILSVEGKSVADYIIVVFYVFNCLPVFFDYIIGIPKFKYIYWCRPFCEGMKDNFTCIIYDLYMIIALFAIFFYVNRHKRINDFIYSQYNARNTLITGLFQIIVILSPYLLIIFCGHIKEYLIYGDLQVRGLKDNRDFFSNYMAAFTLLSLFFAATLFFKIRRNWYQWILYLTYAFTIFWISGKRYIIVVFIILSLYLYTIRSDFNENDSKKVKKIIPWLVCSVGIFSTIYLIFFKVGFVEGRTVLGFGSIYETLRLDFGRDDVIKYSIHRLLVGKGTYLDYYGQSFLSMFLIWIPRTIWKSKPVQHFVYLTAELKGLSIYDAGAGFTPSWYEMCIANFEVFGFFLAIVTIPLFCYFIDKMEKTSLKAAGFLIIICLLTQSIDVYMFFYFILLVYGLKGSLFTHKKIIFKVGNRRLA